VDVIRTQQDTGGRLAAAPDPTAQLMQLGEPEPLCLFNDHDGCSRDVHANLDHRRSNQNIRGSVDKTGHRCVFLFTLHPTVY